MKYRRRIVPFHQDERGELSFLSDEAIKIKTVMAITSQKGAVRASHYHQKDTHYIYLVKGKFEYISQDLKKKNAPKESIVVKPGELVVTPPKIAHKLLFLKDSLMIVLSTEPRKQTPYEKDTVRLEM